jgi:hypothetical protein
MSSRSIPAVAHRNNASQAARELAQRRAEVDDFDKFLAAMQSSLARATSPEQQPTGGTEPVAPSSGGH